MPVTQQPDVSERRDVGVRGRSARASKIGSEVHASACFRNRILVLDNDISEEMTRQLSALALKTEHCPLKTPPQADMQIPNSKNADERALRERQESAGLLEQRLVSFG